MTKPSEIEDWENAAQQWEKEGNKEVASLCWGAAEALIKQKAELISKVEGMYKGLKTTKGFENYNAEAELIDVGYRGGYNQALSDVLSTLEHSVKEEKEELG